MATANGSSLSVRRAGARLARPLLALPISLALLATATLAVAAPASAESSTETPVCNLWASNSGSDSNPGTAAAPVKTVKRLLNKLAAGQTGCLASGQTFAGFTLRGGESHGAEGAPVTITSSNPSAPATIDTRITTLSGANWLTFSHLVIQSDVVSSEEDPSPTINSAHTSWTYDDISGNDLNICVLPSQPTEYGAAEYTLIEHDRVHDCGRPVTLAEEEAQNEDMYEGRLNGWHAHGVYDEGAHTTIRNSYFYDNSSKGILLRGGSYAVVEHNIVDHNGSGVLFGDNGPNHDVVAWNIVTNSTSPCARESGWCDAFGVWSYCSGGCVADSFTNNDVFGNQNGNIAPSYDLCSCITVKDNVEVNPLYVNAATHDYRLQPHSAAVGYGPDTAQPSGASIATGSESPTEAQSGSGGSHNGEAQGGGSGGGGAGAGQRPGGQTHAGGTPRHGVHASTSRRKRHRKARHATRHHTKSTRHHAKSAHRHVTRGKR